MPSASNKNPGVVRVGLTGGFGTGKSTVLEMFRRKGARVMDADRIVHGLLEGDAAVRRRIVSRFGAAAMGPAGRVDREFLAKRIFSNVRDRRALERILHPAVRRTYLSAMARLKRGVAVVDIPLLYETGLQRKFDLVVVVTAARKSRIRRLSARGFSARDFQRRARAQWPLARKKRLADIVVDNDGSKARTKKQIDEIWKMMNQPQRVVRGKNGHT